MTTFLTTDLPSTVNTVEKLAAWAATVLQHLYPSLTVIEQSNRSELATTAQPFFITASDPAVWRYIARQSIPLDPNWQRGSDGIWVYAQDLGSSAIPTEFKS